MDADYVSFQDNLVETLKDASTLDIGVFKTNSSNIKEETFAKTTNIIPENDRKNSTDLSLLTANKIPNVATTVNFSGKAKVSLRFIHKSSNKINVFHFNKITTVMRGLNKWCSNLKLF